MTLEDEIAEIKTKMPETYKAIQAKAAEIGKPAYSLVRRALKGEPNCFWAMERGYVKGVPFSLTEIQRDAAYYMVAFGCVHVCIWPLFAVAGQNGGVGNGAD